jgi:hypothetical protein
MVLYVIRRVNISSDLIRGNQEVAFTCSDPLEYFHGSEEAYRKVTLAIL